MRVAVIGLGVQGRKRAAVAGPDVVATVDPVVPDARYRAIDEVPSEAYDAALVCTPDHAKLELMTGLLSRGKHVLVEKPLLAADEATIQALEAAARATGTACYTAYNHRFEPHLARAKALLDEGVVGAVYLVRGFYGNGTAQDVKRSPWRDDGPGALSDLGSHLLDLIHWMFGEPEGRFHIWSARSFETRAHDHVLFGSDGTPAIQLEVSLVSWRNTFALDVFGDQGSLHVHGLCKWGPSRLILRRRVLPSGKPQEEARTLEQPDPTWELEYQHFNALCRDGGTNLANDIWMNRMLHELGGVALLK